MKMLGYCDVCQWILLGPMLQEIKCIGIGRFRILGGGGGGGGSQGLEFGGGGQGGAKFPAGTCFVTTSMRRNDVVCPLGF